MANIVEFGLTNVYFAKATYDTTTNTVSYGTPQRILGAVNLSLSAESGDDNIFYADNIEYYKSTGTGGFSGTLEIALLPEWVKINLLGQTKNTDGVLVESNGDTFSPFAMMYQVDGDDEETYRLFYYCSLSRPAENCATIEDTKTPQTTTLDISVSARPDNGLIKAMTTPETESSVKTAWFTTVYEQ